MGRDIELEQLARQVRKDILRMSFRAQSAHTGGALSCVELLVALYFRILQVYPDRPNHPLRDRFLMSKAHDAKALYSVLARRGFFGLKILDGYELDDGKLPGHSTRHCVSGVEISAGALGHGLSMGAGIAYALNMEHTAQNSKSKNINTRKPRVFVMLSDGECDEGSTWEAALFAGHHKLDALIAVIDYNKLQGYGYVKDVLDLEPFEKKWESFGWAAKSCKGHNMQEIIRILEKPPFMRGKPSVLIAHTIKGLGGVSAHVDKISSQYKPPSKEEYEEVINRLEKNTS